eukprot:scaffold47616_cov21-Phaeocystis_antarctica.AAC.1
MLARELRPPQPAKTVSAMSSARGPSAREGRSCDGAVPRVWAKRPATFAVAGEAQATFAPRRELGS